MTWAGVEPCVVPRFEVSDLAAVAGCLCCQSVQRSPVKEHASRETTVISSGNLVTLIFCVVKYARLERMAGQAEYLPCKHQASHHNWLAHQTQGWDNLASVDKTGAGEYCVANLRTVLVASWSEGLCL